MEPPANPNPAELSKTTYQFATVVSSTHRQPYGQLAHFLWERGKPPRGLTKPTPVALIASGGTHVAAASTNLVQPFGTETIAELSTCNIQHLPTELLILIFELLLVPDAKVFWKLSSHCSSFPPLHSTPLILSLVCRDWKQVVYSAPTLWQHIRITEVLDRPKEANIPGLAAALTRSKPLKNLVLSLNVQMKTHKTFSLEAEISRTRRKMSNFPVWSCMLDHWDRVTGINIRTCPRLATVGWNKFSGFINGTLPNLRWLSFSRGGVKNWDIACPRLLGISGSRNKTALTNNIGPFLESTREFSMVVWDPQNALLPFIAGPWFALLESLFLTLDSRCHTPVTATQWPVTIPNLTTLEIEASGDLNVTATIWLISVCIRAPKLQSLKLPALIKGKSQEAFACQRFPSIQRLTIHMNDSQVHPLLAEISLHSVQLKWLHIISTLPQERHAGIWNNTSDLFPTVEHIVSEGAPLSHLKDFVTQRRHVQRIDVSWKDVTLNVDSHHIAFRLLREQINWFGNRLSVFDGHKRWNADEPRFGSWDEAVAYRREMSIKTNISELPPTGTYWNDTNPSHKFATISDFPHSNISPLGSSTPSLKIQDYGNSDDGHEVANYESSLAHINPSLFDPFYRFLPGGYTAPWA